MVKCPIYGVKVKQSEKYVKRMSKGDYKKKKEKKKITVATVPHCPTELLVLLSWLPSTLPRFDPCPPQAPPANLVLPPIYLPSCAL